MKKAGFILLAFYLLITGCRQAYGQEISDQLDMFDFQEINQALNEGLEQKIDIGELATQAIQGKLDLSPGNILDSIVKTLFKELYSNGKLIGNLLVVGFLSALLKNLTDSFKTKGAGEVGFYVCYIVLVMLLFSSFQLAVDIGKNLISLLAKIMAASIPLLLGLLAFSGNVSGAYVLHPALIFAVNGVTVIIRDVLFPLIIFGAIIRLINNLSDKDMLARLADFFKMAIGWALKGLLFLFITILSLQRISSPLLNQLTLKTAKFTIGSIPMVGDLLSGTMDTVLYWSLTIKNGVLVASIIGLIMVCGLPLFKLAAIFICFKITAGLLQPICDERMIKAIDGVGDFAALLLWATITVAAMFLFAFMIVLSFRGG